MKSVLISTPQLHIGLSGGFHGYIILCFQQNRVSQWSPFFSLFNFVTFSSYWKTEWSQCLTEEAEKWKAEAGPI